ncbi:MAG: hypothetical protein JWL77_6939 [Chthonomonadaceae bacterium]|nr:hypothetical protein [Chthonomonadaceae bacterium]
MSDATNEGPWMSPTPPPPGVAPVVAAQAATAHTGAFCRACGKGIDQRAAICPACGVATGNGQVPGMVAANQMALMNRKSSGVAIVLSLLITGLGHVYTGEAGRGAAFFGAAVVAALSLLIVVGFVALPVVWIWAAVDANKSAERYNMRLLQGIPSGA